MSRFFVRFRCHDCSHLFSRFRWFWGRRMNSASMPAVATIESSVSGEN